MHRTVSGELAEDAGPFPAGTPYRADDPELLLWILAALAESAMLVYTRYVRSLDRDELNALWGDYRVVGRRFGLRERDMPRDIDGFEAYMADMYASGDLFVTPAARELAIDIVLRPPVPLHLRPLVELVNQITVGWLPARHPPPVRLPWDPLRAARCAAARSTSSASPCQPRIESVLDYVCDEVREHDQDHALEDHAPPSRARRRFLATRVDHAEHPGDPYAYSITATLISSVETFTPVIAASAGAVTGSAWRSTTRRSGTPLARAVRT